MCILYQRKAKFVIGSLGISSLVSHEAEHIHRHFGNGALIQNKIYPYLPMSAGIWLRKW
jgi:hypothetical protein